MKTFFIAIVANLIFSITVTAQTTIVLQPAGAQGKDAEVFSCVPCGYDNTNFGYKKDFAAIAWTNSGNLSKVRSLIQFDLTMIPTNATILDAKLNLYFNTTSGEGNHSGSNAAYLQRILAPWDENTVTWNNQPAVTTTGQVQLPTSVSSQQNYLNIDVRGFVMDMVANPADNYGFMMRLVNETVSKKLILSSSDHNTPSMRPMLVITYTTPLPVEFLFFNGKTSGGGNILEWSTACEVNCSGYFVERSLNGLQFEDIGYVNGNGTTAHQSNYSFTDRHIESVKYYYRLRQADFNGDISYSKIVVVMPAEMKGDFAGGPNPFSESAVLSYVVDRETEVDISVFSANGKYICKLFSGTVPGGKHQLEFNPSASGINGNAFIIRAQVGNDIVVRRLICGN